MRSQVVLIFAVLLLGCSRRASGDEETESAVETASRADDDREGAAIIKMLQESQRKGLVGQDLVAFMRIWADDARLVLGRTDKPGPFDEVIPIARVEGYWKRRGMDLQTSLDVSFKREKARVSGERAEVKWDTVIRETHKQSKEVAVRVEREVWRLRKTERGWRVHENRVWPVSFQRGTEPRVVYDGKQWAGLDEEVEKAKRSGDDSGLLRALYSAHRYGEGHDTAVKVTTKPFVNATQWFWRAAFAMNLYFIEDAITSFRRQLELDERADIPPWARVEGALRRPAPDAPDAGP